MNARDREWYRRAGSAGYEIEKRHHTYAVLNAKDQVLRRFQRRFEAEAFISRRLDLEIRGVEELIERRAAELADDRAERVAMDRPERWDGSLPAEFPGHAVYRAIGHDGVVLYVGVTNCLWRRIGDHRQHSAWWLKAAEIDWKVYPSRLAAVRVEDSAIRRHRPRYNIQGLVS